MKDELSSVVHLERATIRVDGIGTVHLPPIANRDVAAQKQLNLRDAVRREALLLGAKPPRVRSPRFTQITIELTDQQ